MKKYAKILAAIAAAAAIISCTACGNKNNESGSSSNNSSSVSEAADDSAADDSVAEDGAADDEQAATTQEQAAGTQEQAAPSGEVDANAEGGETAASKLMGSWVLAGLNGMDLNTYGQETGLTPEELMVVVTIDENGYTSESSTGAATYAYTPTETGISVAMTEEFTLDVIYIEEADSMVYIIAGADAEGNAVQLQYTFMRNA